MIYLISSIVIIVTLLVYTIVNIKEVEELKITKKNSAATKGWQQLIKLGD